MGDDSELREVLVNMVFNAIDAMPEGGTLTLSTRTVNESVVIKVVDTGVGMYPEVRSRIFDPFFTTKGKAGLGLGLAVSFGIIRRHGGNIEVESQYGSGTEFRITLPLAKIVDKDVAAVEQDAGGIANITSHSAACHRTSARGRDCSWSTTKTLCGNCCARFWKVNTVTFTSRKVAARR